MPVCACACVWLLSLIWKQLTPLSCYAGCNPNQTKALPLSLSLSNPPIKTVPSFNLSSPSSFVTLSIISFFFHFTLVHFQSYLKTLLFPPLVQPFLLLYETCLYKVNLPLTKGCPSASLGVLEKCFEKCVERIKVRPGARTSSFYLSLLDSWAPKHRQTDAHRPALPFSVFYLTKLTQWNSKSHTTKLFGVSHVSGGCIMFTACAAC